MINDMTYIEIDILKNNIKEFIVKLGDVAEKENYRLTRADESFYSSIAKYIVFCKYLVQSSFLGDKYQFLDNIISDSYYLILSLIKKEKRYMYVNERSIIENNVRMITFTTLEDNYITSDAFEKLKTMAYRLKESEYSLLRSEYRVACDFVHGGLLQHENLSFVLDECLKKDELSEKDKNAFYCRVLNILKIFNYMLIAEYTEEINGCFHRRKSLMGYLIGDNMVDYIFDNLNNKR
jgi:hypothetical protein|uniref:Uncharacterized protein n=1 Tax=Siphoviridae sp. ctGyV19 TaxID=2826225 RepID=A0A8S5MUV6_9CAUD|nr:MAG TPA: hypothetical protein [Siphoviridae sp. ctGyV19]